jgi:hypothetical protein
MKQSLFLTLLVLFFVSAQSRVATSLKGKQCGKNHVDWINKGYMKLRDIGSNNSVTWGCNFKDGKVYSNPGAKGYVKNALKGKCNRVDVDTFGMPWVTTTDGHVFRLHKLGVSGISTLVWQQVWKAKGKLKAVDVGCGNTKYCYWIVNASSDIWTYTGFKAIKSGMKYGNPLSAIDIAKGRGGDVALVITTKDNSLAKLYLDGKSKQMHIGCSDVTADLSNQIYCINNNGLYLKRRQNKKFVFINESIGTRISAGDMAKIWAVGSDKFPYFGTHNLISTSRSGQH